MARKFDHEEAFQYWVAQGEERSITALAKRYNVARRSMTKAALRGKWHSRLDEIERKASERADKKLVETLAEIRDRHLKVCRAIQTRGVQAIQAHQLDDAMQGVKAVEIALKLERLILGEPDTRTAISVEDVTRREVESLLATADEPADDDEY